MPCAAKYTVKLPLEKARIKQELLNLDLTWQEKPEQHCDYRLDGVANGGWLRAKQFTNGTLYLEASDEALLAQITQLLNGAPQTIAKPASRSTHDKPSGNLNLSGTYIGTDESGKGDYFGPLVIAGVLVTDQTAPILTELGVMDSKRLNGKTISELSQKIIQVVGPQAASVIEIGPKRYNELYERFKQSGKNLNHLLAWGHATAIENLLTNTPDCLQAIADQFGNERYILSQLKDKGKQITLHQTPRAEANVGVAAASILARHRFVQKMKKLSQQFGIDLPTGAGPQVKRQAQLFIARHGQDRLHEVAKLHFKTTQEL